MNLKTHRLLIGKRGSYRQGGSHPNERTNERTKESRKEGGRLACRKAGTKEPRKEGMNHVSASFSVCFSSSCQVKGSRFYENCIPKLPETTSSSSASSTSSFRSQWAAGPQPQARDLSVNHGLQISVGTAGFNRELLSVGTGGPQRRAPDLKYNSAKNAK